MRKTVKKRDFEQRLEKLEEVLLPPRPCPVTIIIEGFPEPIHVPGQRQIRIVRTQRKSRGTAEIRPDPEPEPDEKKESSKNE